MKILKLNRWWLYKVSPLLGIAYLFIYVNKITPENTAYLLFWFLVAVTGIAGTGYFINDFFDRKSDILSGKQNMVAVLSLFNRLLLLFILLTISAIPWFFLPHPPLVFILIGVQFLFFILYSHPLTRFKEKTFLGVISDALYGHIIPFLLTAIIFTSIFPHSRTPALPYSQYILILVLGTGWQFIKGLRNILLHQIDDRKNDRKAGFSTFVLKIGPLKTINSINRIILPVELITFVGVLIVVSLNIPYFYLWFLFFLIWSFFLFSVYRIRTVPVRQFRVKFLFFFNDFYEMWMPVVAAGYLAYCDKWFIVIILLHVILFNKIPVKIFNDFRIIVRNLITFFKVDIKKTNPV
ncbi:MAG: UbiA family prenyltransferase [Bacteroidetes bacterium]|nr:UbiA family prenyltransferase [Bacteroidota bacterium]